MPVSAVSFGGWGVGGLQGRNALFFFPVTYEIRDQNAAGCIFTGVTSLSPMSGTDPDAL